ncbi:MAG: hypothetical protein V3T30_08475, partial [Thermodesulfobacteriota bacterium]
MSIKKEQKTTSYIKNMRMALTLARRGIGSVSPNPAVGAVVLDRRGEIVGKGYHKAVGMPHAEVEALNRAGVKAKGGKI